MRKFFAIILVALTGNIPRTPRPYEWYVLAHEEIRTWHYLVVLPWTVATAAITITTKDSVAAWILATPGIVAIILGYLTLWCDCPLLGDNPELNLQVRNHFYALTTWTSPVFLVAHGCALMALLGAVMRPQEKLIDKREQQHPHDKPAGSA